jgi:DNA mismatch repair protein MLH1
MLGLESSESGWTPQDQDKNSLAESVVDVFKQKGEMLEEYFSMKIDVNGCLVSLPVLLDSFSPNLDKLPLFILRLATEVNWQIEQECFEGIAKELSLFYEIKHDQFLLDSEGDEDDSHLSSGDSVLLKRLPWRWIIEHVVFPAARRDLIPPKSMADDGTILQIADLKELYKVFERC